MAKTKSNQDNNFQINLSSQNHVIQESYQFDKSLEIINEIDDSQLKVMLLNDLALSYAQRGNNENSLTILEQSLSIAKSFEDVVIKVTNLTNIARYYYQINHKKKAVKILENTVKIIKVVEDKFLQGQLLLGLSFKYREIGEEESAQKLLTESQIIITEASQPLPEFPFSENNSEFQLGLGGVITSFLDTTAFMGINVDFYQQWSEDDLNIDANIYLDYDSSRSFNNYRPSGLILVDYRHHFNSKWHFFTDVLNSTNQNLFSSRNNNEDLVIITEVLLGAGLNLWRGNSPNKFFDLQLGIGSRYEYDFIEFEQKRNQIDPAIGIILAGRSLPIGEGKLNNMFIIVPTLNDFDNYIITSDTKLSIPLSEKWSFTNRLFLRYRNQVVLEDNPNLEFFFTTGLEYEF